MMSKSRNATAEPTWGLHSILPIYKAFEKFLFGRAVSKASRKKSTCFFADFPAGKIGHNFPPEPRLEFEECGGCKDAGG